MLDKCTIPTTREPTLPKIDTCPTCHGRGEHQTSEAAGFNAAHAVWIACRTCAGYGMVADGEYGCGRCCDTGIDVDARDFDPASPMPCPGCQRQEAA